jgi:N-acetylglucosaminyldiphosphoundecaprenol N-acetyl-beta-D-mannosaminyltransferase
MERKRINILGAPVDALTMDGTIDLINTAIKSNKPIHHVVVNAAKIVNMKKDKELYDSVVSCDIINADGQAVIWAAKILGTPLPERVTGIDLMENIVKLANKNNYRIFFFGAKEEIVKKIVEIYTNKYSKKIISGYRNGYFQKDEENNIAAMIADSKPDILFVAIPSPRKEIFLNNYKNIIKVPFIMGVGGSFDVVSGKISRAPIWMQNIGMEWFYRFVKEPRKMWKRYLTTNSLFIYYLLKKKIFNI